jgi:hypothetical protein
MICSHEFWSGMGRELQYDLRCDQNALSIKTCLEHNWRNQRSNQIRIGIRQELLIFRIYVINNSNASRIFRFWYSALMIRWDELYGIETDMAGIMWVLFL